ncbi:metallophosphoesterase family protein [Marinitoga aeolica]|uniref:Phosphoesterase n=1 Tax=Marinitoga aeolica TaxID=2809031 RepID=A0ABY8PTD7_9BACT|nr:YfcE family phosphodiesterase [Marinitoga aeolica]WGS65880.1 YfcE family phosphodiesterase [Marinitoga aeolica]
MIKVLLISDIHIPKRNRYDKLEKINYSQLDYIIATGDYIEEDVIFYFKSQKPIFYGVFGNADEYNIKFSLPEKRIIKLGNYNIGIIHGHQAGWGDPSKLIQRFNNIDVLIYGHSHKKDDRVIKGIRCINPGAFCDGKYAILEMGSDSLSLKWMQV